MATAMGVLASTGALRTHISQLFSFFLVHLLEIYTCLSNTQIYSTLGGTRRATLRAAGRMLARAAIGVPFGFTRS